MLLISVFASLLRNFFFWETKNFFAKISRSQQRRRNDKLDDTQSPLDLSKTKFCAKIFLQYIPKNMLIPGFKYAYS